MRTRRIAKTITTVLYFITFVVIIVACDTEQGMMQGNRSMGMANWNWAQILISLALGFLLGFLLGMVIRKRK